MFWLVQDPKRELFYSFKDRTAEQGFLCIAFKQQSGNQLCFTYMLPWMCDRLFWLDVNCQASVVHVLSCSHAKPLRFSDPAISSTSSPRLV